MAGIWWQFLLGFGHESYRENLQRLRADRDVDVEVRGLRRRSRMVAGDVEVVVAMSGMRGWRG
jgi:hypothetical protein